MAPRRGSPGTAGADKPLAGQVFFFDLHGFRSSRRLESDVVSLGGRVKACLSKDVICVITNRDDKRISHGPPSDKSFLASQSRGRATVKYAQRRSSRINSKVDVLATATAWGIQIKHVKVLLEWIENIQNKQLGRKRTPSSRSLNVASRSAPTRQIRGRQSSGRTSCKCKSACPHRCPFDDAAVPQPMQTRATTQRMQKRRMSFASRRTPMPKMVPRACSRKRITTGFCELCNISFHVTQSHARTIQHQQFADYWRNYTRLVRHSTAGPDITAFLRELRKWSQDSATPKSKKTSSSKQQHTKTTSNKRNRANRLSGCRKSVPKTRTSISSLVAPSPTPVKQRRTERDKQLRKQLKQVQRKLSFSGFDDDLIGTRILANSRTRGAFKKSLKSSPLLTTPKKRKLESSGSYTQTRRPVRERRALSRNRAESPRKEPQSKKARQASDVIKVRRTAALNFKKKRTLSRRYHTRAESRKQNNDNIAGRRKSVPKNPVSVSSPVALSPSLTPVKQRRTERQELRKQLKQIERKLSFTGFDDDPIETKILTGSRTRARGFASTLPKSSPVLTTPTKRKLESRGSNTAILPSSRRPARRGRASTRNRAGSPEKEPQSKRARRETSDGRRSVAPKYRKKKRFSRSYHTRAETIRRNKSTPKTPVTSASPIAWSLSPTPVKQRRTERHELRMQLKQVQRKLSFSGFDDDRIETKILSGSRTRGRPITSSKSSPNLTTPKKRKFESSGSYTELLSSSRCPERGGRGLKRNRAESPKVELRSKRARRTSKVLMDLMIRLDDAKANRPDTPPLSVPVQEKKPTKTRPRPRRSCVKRQKRSKGGGPTVQQVARKLKRELAATTPVICTMSLRNGKMKFSQL